MANELLGSYKEAILTPFWTTPTTVRMVATNHTPAAEVFLDDLTNILATSEAIAGRTSTGGVADCTSPIEFLAAGQTPGTANQFYLYIDTGDPETSRLIARLDNENTGIPYSVAGADFVFNVAAEGVFAI